jgi:transcriptional regulator with XRE-family HTH domain
MDDDQAGPGDVPLLPGFREMALRRMTAQRRDLVAELADQRQSAGLSQTEIAARMGTSQSAVARLEAGAADVRASTLERYAAAIGSEITWRLGDRPPHEITPQPGARPAHQITPQAGSRPPHQVTPQPGDQPPNMLRPGRPA